MDPSASVNAGAVEQGRHAASGKPWDGLEGRDRHAAAIRAAQKGDKAAFDVLMTDLGPLVWHVARGSGLDREHAEDVMQTVWLALLRHLGRLTEPRALASWLITTTRREAGRVRRRETVAGSDTLDEAAEHIVDESSQPESEALRSERDRRLWAAFHQLTQREQNLLRFTVLAGRVEYRAVAEALHMPPGSIGPTRSRALNRLRQLYNEMDNVSATRYVPLNEPLLRTANAAEISLWRIGTELLMPVYTSRGALREALGTDRSWIAVQRDRLPDLLAATPADRFVEDSSPAAVRAVPETATVDRRSVPMIGSVQPPVPKPVAGDHEDLVAGLQELLRSGRPPSGPITEPWTLAYPGLGELRVTPSEIVFDGDAVPWDKVTEIRTRQITDYVNADALHLQVDTPTLRGAILTVAVAAVEDRIRAGTDPRIPAEIEYVDHRGRRHTRHAGAMTALFLTDPVISESVLATARARNISVHAPTNDEAAARRAHEALLLEHVKLRS